jgi:hypothetical protein
MVSVTASVLSSWTGDIFAPVHKGLDPKIKIGLTEHLGYEKGDPAGRGKGNSRNGTSAKTLLTEDGEVEIAVPRDRAGSFEPMLIAKGHPATWDESTAY